MAAPHGRAARRARRWRRLSDLGQATLALAPLAALWREAWRPPAPARAAARGEALAVVRTLLAARLLSSLIKVATRRPRPGAAPGAPPLCGSFPSGHATTAAAGGVMWARLFCRHHPAGGRRRWVAGAAAGLAGATAYGRLAGGRHYVSDVACGLALGAALGWGGTLGPPRLAPAVRRWRPSS